MQDKLYKVMNWPRIENIVYSEEDNPHEILGVHRVGKNLVFQAFFPDAVSVHVLLHDEKKILPMELVDEAGFFAASMLYRKITSYQYEVRYEDGAHKVLDDPYRFLSHIIASDTDKFGAGIYYKSYEKLGAHLEVRDGVEGCSFAVWAPNAVRVSVVGDFNQWDGRMHQMRRLWDSGIFEIFIPGIRAGECYKYELKLKDGLTYLKADPYAFASEMRPNTASRVADMRFTWEDEEWIKKRTEKQSSTSPISIYQVCLSDYAKKIEIFDENEAVIEFPTYDELAEILIEQAKKLGFTHVQLMPMMEYPLDESMGYQTIGYYAPTSRFGLPKRFKKFVQKLHQEGIGVILEWNPVYFPKDEHGLRSFDGTSLYEHMDSRKGQHPYMDTLLFNYSRNEVKSYLIANALFWIEEYHIDGIKTDFGNMLYLDADRSEGQWIPNLYGGNENLELVEFMKHLNSIMKKKHPDVLMIAEEGTAWPNVTGIVDESCLGFDMKWNDSFAADLLDYMKKESKVRKDFHNELTFSMVYAYSENYMLPMSYKFLQELEQLSTEDVKCLMAYQFMHPGKKLWNGKALNTECESLATALNRLYKENTALFEADYEADGFEWIDSIDYEHSKLSFIRKSETEMLLVVCNFSDNTLDSRIGVPKAGKYKEILNTDALKFGGSGIVNPRVKQTLEKKADGQPYSIKMKMAGKSVSVLKMKIG